MNAYFITSTGTDAGKTFLTCAMTWQLRQKGKHVMTLKPVISGYDPARVHASDTGLILESLGLPQTDDNAQMISPWRYAAPLAPNMAATREGRTIVLDDVVKWCQGRLEQFKDHTVLIEGVGGVMAPISDTQTVLDWIMALQLPLILVGGSYLGSISHTLTAYAALRHAGAKIHRIVLNESPESPVEPQETLRSLQGSIGADVHFELLARAKAVDGAWKNLRDDVSHMVGG